jgi:hypothetical protein
MNPTIHWNYSSIPLETSKNHECNQSVAHSTTSFDNDTTVTTEKREMKDSKQSSKILTNKGQNKEQPISSSSFVNLTE